MATEISLGAIRKPVFFTEDKHSKEDGYRQFDRLLNPVGHGLDCRCTYLSASHVVTTLMASAIDRLKESYSPKRCHPDAIGIRN